MKKILSAIAVAASATLPVFATVDPDCVLYYDFETLAEDGYTVENIANPGVMQLSGGTNGLATVVDATPDAKIRQTRTATPAGDSAKALYYVTDETKIDSRCCTPPDGTDYFATTNFTIELFYKMDGDVTKFRTLFKRKGANNVQVNLGVGENNNKLTAEVMSGEAEPFNTYKINDPETTNDGQWHHVALVVDQTGETKTARLYRDYKLRDTETLATNLTSFVRNNDPKWYVIGSGDRYNGYDYNFNGWVDSVRVTLRALEPQEFLWGEGMSIGRFPCGATIAHMKFDGSVNAADADGGTLLNGVNAAFKDGGSPAAFSDDVPGARIIDGVDGEVLSRNNTKSLAFSDSKVIWSDANDTYYLRKTLAGDDRTSWTVEFFMKATSSQPQWAHVVNALKNGNWGSGYPYMIQFHQTTKFSLRGSGNDPTIDCNVNICDGKWHHVAFTFAPNADNPDTTSDVKFYVDYGTENAENGGWTGSATTTTDRVHPDNLHFVVGGGNSGDTGYNGLIDELRISAGALAPSQFLRAERAPGLSIFVR